MNRIYLFFFAFLLFLFFQIPVIKENVIVFANSIKEKTSQISQNIEEKITFFKNQSEEIKKLKSQNKNLQAKLATLEAFFEDCKEIKEFKFENNPKLYFVKTISYAALPDFTKIYVNYPKSISSPRGLVYNNIAAGIVVKNYGGYSLALLNSNEKTSYAVMIGDKKIPGIFKGKINTIKYIPKFEKIKEGDIVKTSGLDNIFYKGALVGKIIKVEQKKLYQEAKVELFYKKMTPDYFYVVEKNATINNNVQGGKNGRKTN